MKITTRGWILRQMSKDLSPKIQVRRIITVSFLSSQRHHTDVPADMHLNSECPFQEALEDVVADASVAARSHTHRDTINLPQLQLRLQFKTDE